MAPFLTSIIFAASALMFWFVSLIIQWALVEMLASYHPSLFKKLGEPTALWTSAENITFGFSFLLARKFKKEQLEPKVYIWCNIGAITLTISIIFFTVAVLFGIYSETNN